jgi:hypothetical protein
MSKITDMCLPLEGYEFGWILKPKRGPSARRVSPVAVWVEGQECVRIPLTKGKFAIVDKSDADAVLRFAWQAQFRCRVWYAARRVCVGEPGYNLRGHIRLHQFVFGETPLAIDHRNRDGLDCRRGNLRKATSSQNTGNSATPITSKTGFKGVMFRPAKGNRRARWVARIGPKRKTLGSFQCPIEAAKAYNKAALEQWGEFARLNTFEST